MSEDGLIFKATIREGLKWSDGVPVTTDDVAFKINDVLLNKELNPVAMSWLTWGDGTTEFQIIDDRTFGFKFALPDYAQGMPQLGQGCPGRGLALLDLFLEFANSGLVLGRPLVGAGVDPFQLDFELCQFLGNPFEFLAEVLPAGDLEGDLTDPERGLNAGARKSAGRLLAQLFVRNRNLGELFVQLDLLLVLCGYVEESLPGFVALPRIGRATLFYIGRSEVNPVVQFLVVVAQPLGQLDYDHLDQGRTADGFLHPQFAPLHLAGQGDLTVTGQ